MIIRALGFFEFFLRCRCIQHKRPGKFLDLPVQLDFQPSRRVLCLFSRSAACVLRCDPLRRNPTSTFLTICTFATTIRDCPTASQFTRGRSCATFSSRTSASWRGHHGCVRMLKSLQNLALLAIRLGEYARSTQDMFQMRRCYRLSAFSRRQGFHFIFCPFLFSCKTASTPVLVF